MDAIICSPLNVGGGHCQVRAWKFPVPAPATVELLKGAPVYSSGGAGRTGDADRRRDRQNAVLRASVISRDERAKSGYGAGSRDFPAHPNVARLTLGEATSHTSLQNSHRTHRCAGGKLDDLNPQVFGYVMDRLLEEGALDAFAVPVQMKKNRPGTLLTVLCKPEDAEKLTQLIFAETTTLGVRRREEMRQALARRWENVCHAMGRDTDKDCQHEWYGDKLCPRI